MNPEHTLQDVVRCHLCDTPGPNMQCYICDKNLCNDCEEKHISDDSTAHKLVPFKLRRCITKCQKHISKKCDRFCERCNVPICDQCVTSREHKDHETVDVVQDYESKLKVLQRELRDLENSIYPKYQEIAASITTQRDDLNKDSEKLKTDINTHGEDLNREINSAVKKMIHDLNEIDSKYLASINKQKDSIKHAISEIKDSINELNEILNSSDINRVSTYKS